MYVRIWTKVRRLHIYYRSSNTAVRIWRENWQLRFTWLINFNYSNCAQRRCVVCVIRSLVYHLYSRQEQKKILINFKINQDIWIQVLKIINTNCMFAYKNTYICKVYYFQNIIKYQFQTEFTKRGKYKIFLPISKYILKYVFWYCII